MLQPTEMYLLLSGAQVEYKLVDLQSYEARNGASFSFPSMYRRLKSTLSALREKANLKRDRKSNGI